jgi:hypothetical protein
MSKEIVENGSTFELSNGTEIPVIVYLNNPLHIELHSSIVHRRSTISIDGLRDGSLRPRRENQQMVDATFVCDTGWRRKYENNSWADRRVNETREQNQQYMSYPSPFSDDFGCALI